MRTYWMVALAAMALAGAACSPGADAPASNNTVAVVDVPEATENAAVPAEPQNEQASVAPAEPAGARPMQTAPTQARPAEPPLDRASFARREQRLTALLNNALARDVNGEVEAEAAAARAQRARCTTRRCVENAYAAQEASLMQWEGSDEIMKQFGR